MVENSGQNPLDHNFDNDGKSTNQMMVEARNRLKLPFSGIEEFPHLISAFEKRAANLNQTRAKYGLEEIQLDPSHIRMLDQQTFKDPLLDGAFNSPFFDWRTGICYIGLHEEQDGEMREHLQIYEQSHELAHKTFPGFTTRILGEGFTDLDTEEFLETEVFPNSSDTDWQLKRLLTAYSTKIHSGRPFSFQDIIYVDTEGDRFIQYSYWPEKEVLRKIRTDSPDVFKIVQAAYYRGKEMEAIIGLRSLYGPFVASLIMQGEIDVVGLMILMEENKQGFFLDSD